jgi:hypothetical protein
MPPFKSESGSHLRSGIGSTLKSHFRPNWHPIASQPGDNVSTLKRRRLCKKASPSAVFSQRRESKRFPARNHKHGFTMNFRLHYYFFRNLSRLNPRLNPLSVSPVHSKASYLIVMLFVILIVMPILILIVILIVMPIVMLFSKQGFFKQKRLVMTAIRFTKTLDGENGRCHLVLEFSEFFHTHELVASTNCVLLAKVAEAARPITYFEFGRSEAVALLRHRVGDVRAANH